MVECKGDLQMMRLFALVLLLALSTAQVFDQRMYESSGRPIGHIDGERLYSANFPARHQANTPLTGRISFLPTNLPINRKLLTKLFSLLQ
jgi:hypothetical protein